MRLKLDLQDSADHKISIAIALCLVMALAVISFCSFFFTQHVITYISSKVP